MSTRRQIRYPEKDCLSVGSCIYADLTKAQKFSKEDLTIYFSDIRHKVGKVSARIEEMKEMVEIYNDTDFVTSSNRTNTVLSILTIFFTLTLPAAVIDCHLRNERAYSRRPRSGGVGILWNLHLSNIILVLMLVPTITMALYFKRRGWF